MEIYFEEKEMTLTVKLVGDLDYNAADNLKESLKGMFNNIWFMEYDLAGLRYTSSAGIRVFMENELAMRKRGGLSFINVNDEVMQIFKMVGLDKVFVIK